VSTTTLPSGTVQVPYSATLAATGGTPPYSWRVVASSAPPGLALGGSLAPRGSCPRWRGGLSRQPTQSQRAKQGAAQPSGTV